MFKHTVTYTDFNNQSRTEDLYFHMMAPEFADLEFSTEGGIGEFVRDAMKSGDGKKVYTFFKLMMERSYGRRTEDGSGFIKKPEFTEAFTNSLAYEEFFMWLVDDPRNAESFWTSLVPKALADKVEEMQNQTATDGKPKHIKDLSREELVELLKQKTAPLAQGNLL